MITGSLLLALFGMLWDISIHIDDGRDEGPLANPAHYAILGGLFGVFAAGFLAIVMPRERTGPTAIRITGDWYAPVGGILITACGAFSLVGFPLDDVWHRLFGQDVTLWGPTHLMLIGGASMTLIGLAVLLVEGGRANAHGGRAEGGNSLARWLRNVALTGAFLLGLSTFQAEFDFGVPQFRFVFAPMLVMLAAGVSLVAARVWLGRGAAIGAALFFLVDPWRHRADRGARCSARAPPTSRSTWPRRSSSSWLRCGSAPIARCGSRSSPAPGSAPWAWQPSGPGRR